MFLGLILILIGALFLLKNLGLLPTGVWPILWPSLLILIGIYIIFLSKRVSRSCKSFWDLIWKKLK